MTDTKNIRPDMGALNAMINIVKRTIRHESMSMIVFQSRVDKNGEHHALSTTPQQLHACGNTACFAGHIAISPEWKAIGGLIASNGAPRLNNQNSAKSLGQWLGVSPECIDPLIFNHRQAFSTTHLVYNKRWEQVTAHDVLKVLNRIKRAGSFSPILKQIDQDWATELLKADRLAHPKQKPLQSDQYPGYNSMYPNMDTLDTMISIIRRAKKQSAINMLFWQGTQRDRSSTEAELHACGNTACFAGYIALSPEWKAIGGLVGTWGTPTLEANPSMAPDQALGQWLAVSPDLVAPMIYNIETDSGDHVLYETKWPKVTADDVLKVLRRIKRAGSFRPIIKQLLEQQKQMSSKFGLLPFPGIQQLLTQPNDKVTTTKPLSKSAAWPFA